MTSIERLDDETLLDLSRLTDELGVLSVYVNADPTASPDAAAIDIKNRYRELLRRVAEDRPTDGPADVVKALDRLGPEVDSLTRASEPGRGRAAFAALGGDWLLRVDSQLLLPNRLVFDERPFIHPLLELLDEGRATGVVLVSADEARLMEWKLGTTRPLSRMQQEELEAPHERSGPIRRGGHAQFHTPMLEQRKDRARARAQQFLDRVATAADGMADERRWERILVSGGARWTEPMADRLGRQVRIVRDARVLSGLDDARLQATVTERLREDHAAREQRLVEQVLAAARRRVGALGLSEVTMALNQGRVAHLVYDPEVRYSGSVGADGTLYADAENGGGDVPASPEPRLSERLVERSFSTGARVSPVEGAARGLLSDAGGIGALLRW